MAVAGAKRLRQVWHVQTDTAFDTAFDVMYGLLDGVYRLPQVGDPADPSKGPIADAGANTPWPRHVWYAGRQDQQFTVAKDRDLLTADGRRLTVTTASAEGSFAYTPNPGYIDWDYFQFKLTSAVGAGAGDSNAATALTLVGRVPRVRFFDMDRESTGTRSPA